MDMAETGMKKTLLAVLGTLLLTGCEDRTQPVAAVRNTDPQVLAQGREVFKKNCAACHGDRAQGAPNWQQPGQDGKYPAPPLDGSGHDWHHPGAWLRDMIRQGSVARGGNMPAWEGKLSDGDIAAVIVWIQSRWPEEIYQSWLAMDEKARREVVTR